MTRQRFEPSCIFVVCMRDKAASRYNMNLALELGSHKYKTRIRFHDARNISFRK